MCCQHSAGEGFVAPGYALGGKCSLFNTHCYSELTLGVGLHMVTPPKDFYRGKK